MEKGEVDILLGTQMGDEGKGRYAYKLSGEGLYTAVARFNGGANAGHTFDYNGTEVNTHQLPSGIAHDGVMNIIGTGALLDPIALVEEIEEIRSKGISVEPDNLFLSPGAHMVLPHHIYQDWIKQNGNSRDGSTLRGISPAASAKYGRTGYASTYTRYSSDVIGSNEYIQDALIEFRNNASKIAMPSDPKEKQKLEEKLELYTAENFKDAVSRIKPFISISTETLIHNLLTGGKNVLAEGAQGVGLDIEQGLRPQTTSSHSSAGGALNGLGIGPGVVGNVYGVAKLIKSRVGGDSASMPTRISDDNIANLLRGEKGSPDYEAGKSTERLRDMGWFDIPEIRKAIEANSINQLFVTKLDKVGIPTHARIATNYRDNTGNRHDVRPISIEDLTELTPEYVDLPTWEQDINGVRGFNELPVEAQDYVNLIEEEIGIPITLIGVGYKDEELIDRRHKT